MKVRMACNDCRCTTDFRPNYGLHPGGPNIGEALIELLVMSLRFQKKHKDHDYSISCDQIENWEPTYVNWNKTGTEGK